ncbi:hypothetical protein LCL97_13365 [Seohaeicola saemankumensis]|nr:hypothetical protein [Seohaeicola saemankumensis]MCA0871821.1 hypothetical protein [Seohaeicola saemankumensis]
MTQTDLIEGDSSPAPRRSRVLRLMIWSTMGLCGMLMAAVVLSEPRVADKVHLLADELNGRLASLHGADDDTQGVAPGERPAVRVMPADRIPVRRAGSAPES